MTHWSLLGRRILAIGPDLGSLVRGPLFGSVFELADVERLSTLQAGQAEMVLIDVDAAPPAELTPGLEALSRLDPQPPVLLIAQRLPAALARSLIRLPLSDVLESPYDGEQLKAAIYALLDRQTADTAPPSNPASRCWSVMGAVGGAGATTIAVEMASALAARAGKERSVCLVDLNLADGAAAAYLGVNGSMNLAQLGPSAERVDGALLAAFAIPAGPGLDLLACPRDPTAFDLITRETVLRILEIACEAYDHVVIDLPRHRRSWTLEVLGGCDEMLVVSELTVPALLAARALCQEMELSLPGSARPRIVLNRLASRMFGPAPSTAEAERALDRKADGAIASDWDAAAASANLGGPIRQHRPKSKIVRDVALLIDHLLARQPQSTRSAA